MNVRRGDIVWLEEKTPIFILGKNVQYRCRPYIVISNNINNRNCPTVNLAAISKNIDKADYPMHVYLDKNKYKLKYDSIVLTEQVCTVNKEYIKEIKSSLDNEDMIKFNRALYIQLLDENLNMAII